MLSIQIRPFLFSLCKKQNEHCQKRCNAHEKQKKTNNLLKVNSVLLPERLMFLKHITPSASALSRHLQNAFLQQFHF